ncbi:hypothetical protein [Daejeonella lutea]|uniref:Uncharacterized protein n=1 Tax=Daejeonella lutea TaxID=572036 RepID=A0A1T5B178_9SPHI|nr:hypothetical protein [Daejeonella lutea]SKB40730.1 hypothetical protein SAMN05661099_1179 [Daejeonella lutea]
MANFTKEDLAYPGYKHTAWPDDDPRLTGKPDSTMLNRNESYEMVYFINRYMSANNWKLKKTFQRLEAYLKDHKEKGKSHAFWRKDLAQNFKI